MANDSTPEACPVTAFRSVLLHPETGLSPFISDSLVT